MAHMDRRGSTIFIAIFVAPVMFVGGVKGHKLAKQIAVIAMERGGGVLRTNNLSQKKWNNQLIKRPLGTLSQYRSKDGWNRTQIYTHLVLTLFLQLLNLKSTTLSKRADSWFHVHQVH